jgi:hypothetical protein
MMELIGDDGLCAFVHVHVFDGPLSRLMDPCQRLQRGTAIRLRFQR